jgi:hypothetical protein
MTARFVEVRANDGFDSTGARPWQMVPMQGRKVVRLVDGAALTLGVLPDNGSVRATLLPGGMVEIVSTRYESGSFEGVVVARDNHGSYRAQLQIRVTQQVVISTAFFFIGDTATPASPGHRAAASHTTRRVMPTSGTPAAPGRRRARPADLDGWLRTMNSIFNPQANVWFAQETGSPRATTVPTNLGRTVNWTSYTAGDWHAVLSSVPTSARFNVFLVWDYQTSGQRGDQDAATHPGGRHCFLEDNAGRDVGESLAHEAGHALGLDHPGHHRQHLMFPTTDVRGRKLTKADIVALRA